MNMKIKFWLIILVVIVAVFSGWFIWKSGIQKNENFICQSDSDCVIKEGQCSPGCFHKDQEPKINLDIVCEYRPWFKQEKCECINNKCTKITCEDLGLDYPECNQ